jgi:hypothetical protein
MATSSGPRRPSHISTSHAPVAPAGPTSTSVADELTKLAALRDSGVLTEDEFAVQKARLLGS